MVPRLLLSKRVSLVKWFSVRLRTKWLWVRVQLQSIKLQISRVSSKEYLDIQETIVWIYSETRSWHDNNIQSFNHGVLQSINPTLKYWPHPFLPRSYQKILNLSDPLPPFMSNPPQNFGELGSLIILTLFANLNWWVIFIHKTILAYKLEKFENYKEVMHIIIIAIMYIFYLMWYLISNRNPQVPPEKIHSPHFTHSSPLKFQKVQVPSFLPTLKFLPFPHQ